MYKVRIIRMVNIRYSFFRRPTLFPVNDTVAVVLISKLPNDSPLEGGGPRFSLVRLAFLLLVVTQWPVQLSKVQYRQSVCVCTTNHALHNEK